MAERNDRPGAADVDAEAGLAETLAERDGAHPTLGRGTKIHRYAVLEQVGSGAMGVVYAAYDAGLDRRIALKVLRDPRRGGSRRRLVREAQALAKLSHPGVIAVYDVGTYRDQVFVAMEFVAGRTVRAWLDETPRSWREVVDVYRRAGEGLAAAHAAGIVHRDFKPDNVLIDEAGRVRVGDFGLALVERGEDEGDGDDDDEGGRGELTLTRAGAAVGTPAYMAPEQRTGRGPVDARADQYSFCVALHEGVYGYRPLAAGSEPEAPPADGAQEIAAERDRQVPGRIRRAIGRGLAASPDERYPSMDALLADVARDPAVTRRRVATGAIAAMLVAAVGAGAWLVGREGEPLCRGAAGKLAGVWDPARKQAVATAFRRSGAGGARAWAAVEPQLDRYAGSWTAMHTASCEATHVRGEQSADLLDLRTQCLDRRLSELRALTYLFASADAATVARAAEATGSLRPLDECASEQALRQVVAPPADVAARAIVERLRSRLAQVRALHATAKWKRGLEQARGVVADARELGYRPLEAEALVMLGTLLRRTDQLAEAEEVIYDAIAAGEAGRTAETTADAWLELVWLVGVERGRHAEGLRLANLARGVIEQDGSKRQEAALARSVGHLYVNLGKLDKARPYTERALALYEEIEGPDDVLVAESLQHMGILEQKMGRLDEALRLFRRAHAIADRKLGPDHPATLSYIGEVASVMVDLGQYAEGLAILERSLAPLERATGPRSGDVLILLTGIGTARRYTEDNDGARAALERALELARDLYGPDHVQVAKIQIQLGRNFTDTHKWTPAREQLESALALLRAAFGPDHPDVVDVIEDIARIDIESGHPARAIAPLEHALTIRDRTPGDPYRAAFCRFELARALHRSGHPALRVRPLVEAAWRGFQQAGDATTAADMKRWLDAPGFREPE